MTYHCKHCKFVWNFADGDIQKLLAHEKTHDITAKPTIAKKHGGDTHRSIPGKED